MSHVTHGIAGTGDRVGHVNIPAAKRPHWNGLIQIGLQGTLESTAGLGTDIQIFMYINVHMHTRISVYNTHWDMTLGLYGYACIHALHVYVCKCTHATNVHLHVRIICIKRNGKCHRA